MLTQVKLQKQTIIFLITTHLSSNLMGHFIERAQTVTCLYVVRGWDQWDDQTVVKGIIWKG